MARSTELAILFADVCGSTRLYETLGDAKARTAIARCVAVMSATTTRHGGTVIKTIGDEVMSTFATADEAAQAAAEMQETITDATITQGKPPLAIRVGFHYGPALLEGGDVFGDAVNVAARMAGQAKAGQILITSATLNALSGPWQASTRQVDLAVVKGKREEIAMHEVLWQHDNVTRMAETPFQGTAYNSASITLEHQGRTAECSATHPSVVLGRQESNDLVVTHNLISRVHCKIDYRKGSFILTDQSINGTYVRTEDGTERFVRRDVLTLEGSGHLGLGQSLTADSPDAVRFRIRGE